MPSQFLGTARGDGVSTGVSRYEVSIIAKGSFDEVSAVAGVDQREHMEPAFNHLLEIGPHSRHRDGIEGVVEADRFRRKEIALFILSGAVAAVCKQEARLWKLFQ